MSVSSKQKNSNKKNAQKSTGPKTKSGKKVASKNATKHGLYARDIIINSPHYKEDRTEYELLFESLKSELDPQSQLQEILVRKIANCVWRNQRAVAAETAHITNQLHKIDDTLATNKRFNKMLNEESGYETESDEINNLVGQKLLPKDTFGQYILRYEMRIDRQMSRAYKLLNQLQNRQQKHQSQHQSPGVSDISDKYKGNGSSFISSDALPEGERQVMSAKPISDDDEALRRLHAIPTIHEIDESHNISDDAEVQDSTRKSPALSEGENRPSPGRRKTSYVGRNSI